MINLDFLKISVRFPKKGVTEIYPKFIIKRSQDLMIRGSDFYACWDERSGNWSTDEQDVINMIDEKLREYTKENSARYGGEIKTLYLWDASSGMIDSWHKYCQKQMRDNYVTLDNSLVFSNQETTREDYSSKKLPYPLVHCDISAYEKIISTLYSEEERRKIEWAIGSVVEGDSKKLQKFLVFYGDPGTGKGTIINIITMLFDGYFAAFDAKALGNPNNAFALEPFKSNPLVGIQHDGDLSKIEDNTRLNSLVSHEIMTVNEKFKSAYATDFKAFLFMGTNKPVKITDAKSGLLRRLIDVTPTKNKLPVSEYHALMEQVKFELGGIALHCRDVYLKNKHRYDNYIPKDMMSASNDFYNFISDNYFTFKQDNSSTLNSAWEMFKTWKEEASLSYSIPKRIFKEELKNYFNEFHDRYTDEYGQRIRNYYIGFRTDKLDYTIDNDIEPDEEESSWLKFDKIPSLFDNRFSDCPAQYEIYREWDKKTGPQYSWDKVKTKLSDLSTEEVHYVKVPISLIVIDFDIKDGNGKKCLKKNLEAASKWPPTYAELSKSGEGIHLHYIYKGDPDKLDRIYDENIEIKVFSGGSSLRRKLTQCNNLPIAEITSGLKIKERKEKNMIEKYVIENEKHLRSLIIKALNKQIHPYTTPSVSFIKKVLSDAYESGMKYDVSDMESAMYSFAMNSSHQAGNCVKILQDVHLKSDDPSDYIDSKKDEIVFFDCEVFPNLFLVNYKKKGKDQSIVRLINPTRIEMEKLFQYKLIGFNNRKYDNHMLYGCYMGYDAPKLYELSQNIIEHKKGFFGEAYNLSYTDIFDYSKDKMSLKKWEIELGIPHRELGLPWDQPVPENLWPRVAEYCDNDVLATEAVFEATQADYLARVTLAEIAGGCPNDSTNSLTQKLIFEDDRNPQSQFIYTDLSKDFPGYVFDQYAKKDKSTYLGEVTGEGGYVYAEPGIYFNVALLDIASMHPHSIKALKLFGEKYTSRFYSIVEARLAIKHRDFNTLETIFGGKFKRFIHADDETLDNLAAALKIAINSVYGLTSAKFDNAFRDPRNVDNIVAKRGALFMINLKHEVQNRGYKVAHIKTDSIKIPNADQSIINFVMEYGKEWGYSFEHEATYERMCLVNDAVYIAKFDTADHCEQSYGYIPGDNKKYGGKWTATGTQFQIPYVFKTLFSKEPIEFKDLCETKSVKEGVMYLDMNEKLPDVSIQEKELDKLTKKMKKQELDETSFKQFTEETHMLEQEIAKGHDYQFVGKVGLFCPVLDGENGGNLYRSKDGKYYAVSGTKGYRWMEEEDVQKLPNPKRIIDMTYYHTLANDAIDTINKYGNFDLFVL